MRKRKLLNKVLNNSIVQFILYSPLADYHQWSLLKFVKCNAKKIKKNEKIIDIGAGELKYIKYFEHCEYKSQDFCLGDANWDFSKIDIKSSAYKIPEKDASFDYVLCTQVLEHLEFPEKAFSEFSRLLKNGGKLILTAPLGFGEHQIPYDFFRYTKYGLKSLGKRNNLKLIEIKPHGGIFINLEYVLWQSKNKLLPFNNILLVRYLYFFIFLPIKILSGGIFIFLDLFDREKTCTLNYNCIYEKI
ncbi:MAG: class I SAM-dependent methyltransferase [Candidatus Taylorbacteria bacterium]|nr:class I SAM-dependent methyltransferase [Candidatus Taylorbacteria bacterium]